VAGAPTTSLVALQSPSEDEPLFWCVPFPPRWPALAPRASRQQPTPYLLDCFIFLFSKILNNHQYQYK
jgi:hypothetical protein